MAVKKLHQSLADYATIALSPALIMTLIGSLVFFLAEVLHGGRLHGSRLLWTLSWFIFGIVLVCRMSMHPAIGERAKLYGLILALLVWFGLMRFLSMDYFFDVTAAPLAPFDWAINFGWIVLIWWCAHRLTWDCTYIDDNVDASGKGVLEAASLDEEAGQSPAEEQAESEKEAEAPVKEQPALPSILAWWDRYRHYRDEQKKKPHTPGVWVVYFSLAALPLFGLGQALVPAADVERRRYTFWLLVVYVASGLGLLLTTCFLGLRRYLRQRRLEMPPAMTRVWIALGAALILALLVLGAVLPRPSAEYSPLAMTPKEAEKREASRHAVLKSDAGKGDGRASSDPPPPNQKGEPGSGTKKDKQGGGQTQGKSGQGSSSSRSDQKGGSKSTQQQGKDGRSDQPQGKSEQRSDKDEDNNSDKTRDEKKQQGGGTKLAGEEKAKSEQGGSEPKRSESSSTSTRISNFFEKFSWLGTLLKWIVFAVLAIAVVFFVLRSGLKWLANFTEWAKKLLEALRAWWLGLLGPRRGDATAGEQAEEGAAREPRRPFASYHNPFLTGAADQMSPDEVARYTFEALEAWAAERGVARQPDETPLEFAERLGQEVPAIEGDVKRLAGLFVRVAYAKGRLTASSLGLLRQFWERLEALAEQPLSLE